jgi:hypothetical protein
MSREIISEEEFDRLPEQSQIRYKYCPDCQLFYLHHTNHICNTTNRTSMTYKYVIEIEAFYPIGDDMKTSFEAASDCGQMICDEITTAGGVGSYNILSHVRYK